MIAAETLRLLVRGPERPTYEVTVHHPEAGEWSLTIGGGEPLTFENLAPGATITITEAGPERRALAEASRRIAAEVDSRALFDRGPLLFDPDGDAMREGIRQRIIAAMERSESEYMERRIAEGGWPHTGAGLDWYAVFGGAGRRR